MKEATSLTSDSRGRQTSGRTSAGRAGVRALRRLRTLRLAANYLRKGHLTTWHLRREGQHALVEKGAHGLPAAQVHEA